MKRFVSILLILALCIGTTAVFADAAEDVVVESNGKILENGVDYTLTYRDNVDPGTATVVVSFIGNYAGMMQRTFEIKKEKRQSTGGGRGSSGTRIVITPEVKYDAPYIMGYEDGTFRPESAITRAEAATAIVRAIGLEPQDSGNVKFPDISNHWAKGYINAAADLNIVNGYEDGNFRPDENITRAELVKVIAKLSVKENVKKSDSFVDVKNHWAETYIATLAEQEIINGYADGTFRPNAPITRAEAVAIINRAVTRNCAPEIKIDFKDVTQNHWAYEEIVKAAGIADSQ